MKIELKSRIKLSTKRIILAVTVFSFLLAMGLIVLINLLDNREARAANIGDYRSKSNGNWNNLSTWEVLSVSGWVTPIATPSSVNGVIEILSGHTVTVTASLTADEILVDAGGTLTTTGGTLTIADNFSSTDIIVNGTWNINSAVSLINASSGTINGTAFNLSSGNLSIGSSGAAITIASGGLFQMNGGTISTSSNKWIVNNGGTYKHNMNGGTLPAAAWSSNSTCLITGITTTAPAGVNQIYGNVTWNCPSQTAIADLVGNLKIITGNFTVISTGTGGVKLYSGSGTLNISGYYAHQGGKLYMTEVGGWTINVAGDFIMSGGSIIMTDGVNSTGDGLPVINISGNAVVTAGTIDMSQYTGAAAKGIGTINHYGNLDYTGGTITATSSGSGYGLINFSKTGTQNFTGTTSLGNKVDISVNSVSILNLGTKIISGGRNFNLTSGAGIILNDVNGITSSGSGGNVQMAGTRTYSTGGNYTYSGSSAQVTGNGLPSLVNNLTLNNTSGLSLTSSVVVFSTLTFTNGNITTPNDTLGLGYNNSNPGTLVRTNATIIGWFKRWVAAASAANYLFPISYNGYYRAVNLSYTNSPSTGGYVTVNFQATNPGTNGLPISENSVVVTTIAADGYWPVYQDATLSSGTYNIDINADGFNNIINYTQLRIVRRANAASPWAFVGTHSPGTGSNTNPVAHRIGIDGAIMGHFAVAGPVTALPITLISFDAKPAGNVVNLTWATGDEINNDYFTVERSKNGKTFEPIIRKNGAGNSTATLHYDAIDESPIAGMNYYRLKQTDYDGRFTYSEVKVVKLSNSDLNEQVKIETIGPNPFIENFNLTYSAETGGNVVMVLTNSAAGVIKKETLKAEKGLNTYEFSDNMNLQPGVYYLTIVKDGKTATRKMIKG